MKKLISIKDGGVGLHSLRATIGMIVLQKGSLFWSTIILIAIHLHHLFSPSLFHLFFKEQKKKKKSFTGTLCFVETFGWPWAYKNVFKLK